MPLKILSPDIVHKSDVGGVALDLGDEAALRDALLRMHERVLALRPGARLAGFTVQAMARRPRALVRASPPVPTGAPDRST